MKTLTKNSTKKIDKKVFNLKEEEGISSRIKKI